MNEFDDNNNSNNNLLFEGIINNNEERIPLKEAENIEEKKNLLKVIKNIKFNLNRELYYKKKTEKKIQRKL